MNIKKGLFFFIFTSLLLAATTTHAATNDNRYLVKSTSSFWKKSLIVRNVFDGGFTADLSDWQLRMTKIFGVEVAPVKKLNILAVTPVPTPKTPVKSKTPAGPVAWGVGYTYGNDLDEELPTGGKDVVVAILDTGVNRNHPDLKNRISDCADFSAGAGFVNGKCDDKNDHGTHMAGIVAADGGAKGLGIYGVAPESKLAIYKVCDTDGTCFSDDVASAIRYAADQKVNIILISIGSDTESTLINNAVVYAVGKGALVIAAGGNDGPDSDGIDYPAAQSEVISVGALDAKEDVPEWSSRGNNENSEAYLREPGDLELIAPGVNIESTGKDGDYVTLSGTSMAAAHVAGLAAKEWQKDADNPADATRDLLHKFTQDILPLGDDEDSGWGVPTL